MDYSNANRRSFLLGVTAAATTAGYFASGVRGPARAAQAQGARKIVTVAGKRVKVVDIHAHCVMPKVADVLQAVQLPRGELHAEPFLGRHDDLDLLERIPALHVLCRQVRLQHQVVAHEYVLEDLGHGAVNLGFSRHMGQPPVTWMKVSAGVKLARSMMLRLPPVSSRCITVKPNLA